MARRSGQFQVGAFCQRFFQLSVQRVGLGLDMAQFVKPTLDQGLAGQRLGVDLHI